MLHDVYSMFDLILSKGIVKLYYETKDITDIKQEINGKLDEKSKLVALEPSRRQLELA